MAPPGLYDLPAPPGVMAPAAAAGTHPPSLRALLWCVAAALASVELAVWAYAA
jgi:hypothetical protein